MILTALALILAPQACRPNADLPRPLAGWTRPGRGLDTRHATTISAGDDRIVSTRVTIRKPGTFGIAIDRDGWIDVVPPRGRPLRPVSEARGPRCSTIRKIVRYKLRPGTYRVSVTRL